MKNALLLLSSILTVSFILCTAAQAETAPKLTPPSPLNLLREVSLEWGKPAGYGSLEKAFSIDISDCRISNGAGITFTGGISISRPGEPAVRSLCAVIELPGKAKVAGISAISGTFRRVLEPVTVQPVPRPRFWTVGNRRKELPDEPDPKIYENDAYFPGRLADAVSGCSGDGTRIYIRFHPVQYNPVTGAAVLVTDIKLRVSYDPVPAAGKSANGTIRSPRIKDNHRNVIITSDELLDAADSLAVFHTEIRGVPSIAVPLSLIAEYFEPAEPPEYEGYAQSQPQQLDDYDFDSALRLISFLRHDAIHPNLEWVTLFGDAAVVPPSYYFYDPESNLDEYNSWLPSDFLYTSPDYDFAPDFRTGRLPVEEPVQAMETVRKIRDWYFAKSWSWYKNAVVTGGVPFYTSYFLGEMMASDQVNMGYLDGYEITKLFSTLGNYSASNLLPYFENGGAGIVYHVGHGSGPAIHFDDGSSINSGTLMQFEKRSDLPVVFSIACMDAAYDAELWSYGFTYSFGEGIVLSGAGGIAYFGGSRINAGISSFDFFDGNLRVTKEEQMAGICSSVMEGVAASPGLSLGGTVTAAIDTFVLYNDMDYFLNRRTCFEFLLLGDPALVPPVPVQEEGLEIPVSHASGYDYMNGEDVPVYRSASGTTITLDTDSGSSSITYLLQDADEFWTSSRVETDGSPPFAFDFEPSDGFRYYLVKAITDDQKEGWFYLRTSEFTIVPDGDPTDWILEGIPPIASDPDNDMDTDELDVTDLYMLRQDEWLHIGFDATCREWDMEYGIALDTGEGGYTGIEGVDQDAFGNWITFGEGNGVDYEIYFPHVTWVPWEGSGLEWEAVNYALLYERTESAWKSPVAINYSGGRLAYGPESDFIEITMPLSFIGSPEHIFASLFSTGMQLEPAPAQDSSPSDPETYTTPTYGQENANTITAFAYSENAPYFNLEAFYLNELIGNGDEIPEPGESFELIVLISNLGKDAEEVTGSLSTPDTAMVLITLEGADFGDVPSDSTATGSPPFAFEITEEATTPFEMDFFLGLSDGSGFEDTLVFVITAGIPHVLLVEDDGIENRFRGKYSSAIRACGLLLDEWDTSKQGVPEVEKLSGYDAVVWFTGAESSTLTEEEISTLGDCLDSGSSLFLTGENIGEDIGGESFFSDYLHAALNDPDADDLVVFGAEGDTIGDEFAESPFLIFNQDYPQESPDLISPSGIGASTVFSYSTHPDNAAGIRVDGSFKVVYLPFAFEGLADENTGRSIMRSILGYLGLAAVAVEDSEEPGIQGNTAPALGQNYPNPLNPVTTIEFFIPAGQSGEIVSLKIFDIGGRLVKTLVHGRFETGTHRFVWNGKTDSESNAASGVYIYRLDAGSSHLTKKLVLLK